MTSTLRAQHVAGIDLMSQFQKECGSKTPHRFVKCSFAKRNALWVNLKEAGRRVKLGLELLGYEMNSWAERVYE